MTTPRITDRSAALGSLAGVQASAARLAALQSKLSSGRAITKPSDDPVGTERALALRGELKRTTQYAANASSGQGWLSQVDSTLTGINNQMQQVRTLTLQGMNTGTGDATSNDALADNIDQLRSSMLSLANTTYEGQPIFGGTTAGSVAFDSTGAYVGDTGAVTRQVGSNDNVTINQTGTAVFGANGSNLFDTLSKLSIDLRTNTSRPAGRPGQHRHGDDQPQRPARRRGRRLPKDEHGAEPASRTRRCRSTTSLSGIQDADVAEMAIQISSANIAYQAALQTTASIRQTSLLDYLR